MKDNSDVPVQYRSLAERREAGKGSKPRPVDKNKFDKGWERAFGKKEKNDTKS